MYKRTIREWHPQGTETENQQNTSWKQEKGMSSLGPITARQEYPIFRKTIQKAKTLSLISWPREKQLKTADDQKARLTGNQKAHKQLYKASQGEQAPNQHKEKQRKIKAKPTVITGITTDQQASQEPSKLSTKGYQIQQPAKRNKAWAMQHNKEKPRATATEEDSKAAIP